MKAYPEYKPSGIDWLGNIPSHWNVVNLKYLINEPLMYGANESPEIETNLSNPRYIRITDIDENGCLKKDTFRTLQLDKAQPYFLKYGDILFARSGATVGKTYRFSEDYPASFAGYLIKASCGPKIDSLFLLYYTNTQCYNNWKNSIFDKSTIQNIAADKYNNLPVVVPPVAEQEAIAAYLDDVTGKIDALISEKQKQVEDIRAYRTSLITETVTRGLNPDTPLRPSGIDWLGDIPEHWKILPLKFLASVQTGSTPSTTEERYWENPTRDWYTPSDFTSLRLSTSKRKVSEAAFKEVACRIFPKNTVMMIGIGGTLGKIGITPNECSANQQINAITFNEGKVVPIFGAYFLYICKDIFTNLSNSATLPILNQEQTKNCKFVLPPLAEQQAIADFLDAKTAKIDELIGELTKQIDELAEYKQAVITEAVTGKVDVRDYKPSN